MGGPISDGTTHAALSTANIRGRKASTYAAPTTT